MKPLDNLVKELDEILGSPSKKIVSTPVWQEKPETLIENTMNIYSAPIKDYTAYQMAKKRLTVLKEYLPTLTEPLKTKCEAVIKILERRIDELVYELYGLDEEDRKVIEDFLRGAKEKEEL